MKITHQLILGSLTAAIFGVECCINAQNIVAIGDGDGNRAVESFWLRLRNIAICIGISPFCFCKRRLIFG